MSYYITNELFPHRVSHAIVESSNLNGSEIGLSGSGLSLAGEGFGKGTRKNILKTVGEVAEAFGTPEQKAQAAQLEHAAEIVKGAGHAVAKKPGTRLRKMMA